MKAECKIESKDFNDRYAEKRYIEDMYENGYELKAVVPILSDRYAIGHIIGASDRNI